MTDIEEIVCDGQPANLAEMPDTPKEKRKWLQAELANHTNSKAGRPWTQADVAVAVEATEGMVALVYSGKRHTGAKAVRIQHLTAKILRVNVDDLFGHICKCCPNCGTPHQPKRVIAE